MSKPGRRILDVGIFPRSGSAEKLVQVALSYTRWGKYFTLFTLRALSSLYDKTPAPHLILINVAELPRREHALAELLQELKQSAWKKVPVVVLDDPTADILYGFADGYAARVNINAHPKVIAGVIESVLEEALTGNMELT